MKDHAIISAYTLPALINGSTAAVNTNAVEAQAKLSAREFSALCDGVSWACDSLSSCVSTEKLVERAGLLRRVNRLTCAKLARSNPSLEAYRASVLRRAGAMLA